MKIKARIYKTAKSTNYLQSLYAHPKPGSKTIIITNSFKDYADDLASNYCIKTIPHTDQLPTDWNIRGEVVRDNQANLIAYLTPTPEIARLLNTQSAIMFENDHFLVLILKDDQTVTNEDIEELVEEQIKRMPLEELKSWVRYDMTNNIKEEDRYWNELAYQLVCKEKNGLQQSQLPQ
jgi:hypothetical protein